MTEMSAHDLGTSQRIYSVVTAVETMKFNASNLHVNPTALCWHDKAHPSRRVNPGHGIPMEFHLTLNR
ncbi:hypothetical protein ANTPLA_LOCUS4334 [Anthophora plagiata]